MTIRHWDAPCKITSFIEQEHNLVAIIELLSPYGDGSGRIGQRLNVLLNQLNADGGWEEIFNAISNLTINFTESRKEQVMKKINEQYEGKSIRELAELYNSMVPASKHVKKFRDRDAALKRMTEVFSQPVAAQKEATQPKKEVKMEEEKPTKKTSTTPASFKLVGRKSANSGKKIYKISKENPRREGSHGFKNWEIYKDGMTYEEFILAKGGANHLSYDIEKGFVELK